ncbi:hypothetical protein E2C01_006304 [Portunus trituberculatus]|uniref:Uncharacterized protein n=1 Tax=Portunus trituberculatus TaxID=210409 RepID=A0A5B7CYZ0_PORTR|nr:hypothetical protein [Portunus trituberculatus]
MQLAERRKQRRAKAVPLSPWAMSAAVGRMELTTQRHHHCQGNTLPATHWSIKPEEIHSTKLTHFRTARQHVARQPQASKDDLSTAAILLHTLLYRHVSYGTSALSDLPNSDFVSSPELN